MSYETVLLPKFSPDEAIILAKEQFHNPYIFWAMSILIFSPFANFGKQSLVDSNTNFVLQSILHKWHNLMRKQQILVSVLVYCVVHQWWIIRKPPETWHPWGFEWVQILDLTIYECSWLGNKLFSMLTENKHHFPFTDNSCASRWDMHASARNFI